MEFKVLLKSLPFNAIRLSGRLFHLTLRSFYLVFKFLFRTTTDVYVNALDNINRPCESILILGSRNSGKSSLLYRIKLAEFISTTPTGSSIEEEFYLCRFCLLSPYNCGHSALKEYDKVKIKFYELGFNDPIATYQYQIQICNKIIYVVDCFGDFRYSEINKEINTLISEHNYHHRTPKYVIFLTKNVRLALNALQDIFGGLNYATIKNALEIPEQLNDKHIVVKGSALTGDGTYEALSFLLFDKKPGAEPEKHDLISL